MEKQEGKKGARRVSSHVPLLSQVRMVDYFSFLTDLLTADPSFLAKSESPTLNTATPSRVSKMLSSPRYAIISSADANVLERCVA